MKALKGATALISVSDKAGLVELAQKLEEKGIHIIASSGTKSYLEKEGVDVEEISAYTQSPEILGGRVKTLHPKIHGGILADRDNPEHVRTLEEQGTRPIDFVVVNLYPFEEKYREGSLEAQEMIEFIDIGGITLLRAAAKNHKHVSVVTSPEQYPEIVEALEKGGGPDADLRARLAAETFALTASYDAAIAGYLRGQTGADALPRRLPLGFEKVADARYGENPHQRGALYRTVDGSPLLDMVVHQGKALSFNNYLDIVGAFALSRDIGPDSVSIIKHTNPCGVGWRGNVLDSFRRALSCDPVSAFGGIVAVNGALGAELAQELTQMFLEVVIARSIDDGALEVFRKKKNLRVVSMPEEHWKAPDPGVLAVFAQGIMLFQEEDLGFPELEGFEAVTSRKPSEAELFALKKGWVVARHVKSNAIVIADGEGTVGIGAGQMSRVDSSHIATRKAFDAKLELRGAVAASDAFFPFADGVRELAGNGVTAVIQPGGSIRDEEVVDAANAANVAMLFTGRRHFRHI